MAGYTITEKDIEGMLRYLRAFHPDNANREFASELLAYMQATYHRLALSDPDTLEELYGAFSKQKNA